MKVGIVFDPWKLPIFQRHLDAAGLAYEPLGGVPSGSLGLHVTTDDPKFVENIVRAANAEAATKRETPEAN